MKKIIVLLLAVFIFGGSALAFAWWDSLTAEEEGTIELGYGNRIQVISQTTVGEGNLVPQTADLGDGINRTHAITFTYDVTLEEVSTTVDFTLSLPALNAFLVSLPEARTETPDEFNLINMNITINDGTTDVWDQDYTKNETNVTTTGLTLDSSTTLTVTVTFTITEPDFVGETYTESEVYGTLAGANVDFDLLFEIVLPE